MAILDTFPPTGKTALLTGGAGLYGRQILRAFAEAGARTSWRLEESHAFEVLAAEAGIGTAEPAVRFMLGLAGVTSLVMGVDTVAQLGHTSLAAAVTAAIPWLPEAVVSPPLWPKRDA